MEVFNTLCIPDVSVAIVSMRNKQLSLMFCHFLPLEVTMFSISVFPLKGSTAVVNVRTLCTSNLINTQQVDVFINFNYR